MAADTRDSQAAETGRERTASEGQRTRKKKSLFDLDEVEEVSAVKEERPDEEEDSKPPSSSSSSSAGLTAAQRARAERNRLKALSLKQARLLSRRGEGSSKDVGTKVTITGETTERSKEKKV